MGIFSKKQKEDVKSLEAVAKKPRAAKKEESVDVAKEAKGSHVSSSVLLAPVVSEKAVMAEVKGIYTFRVAMKATKIDIAREVLRLYGVKPRGVRIVHVEGKSGRFGRSMGRRVSWKKAVMTLPKGKTISIHSGV